MAGLLARTGERGDGRSMQSASSEAESGPGPWAVGRGRGSTGACAFLPCLRVGTGMEPGNVAARSGREGSPHGRAPPHAPQLHLRT
ncbi:uncharacterized protein B0I36DRAFT_311512 [Microdochium trichocladiopsis]|uniref:Uncharacterized protein n=1 Tax=Microdochium trichocladiopsis TaxID=1682393 RepID=A0A9P9C059_9PEZI|nr:uncharacterized protein B0I36DRAFT_311512 [Microdochium trichocladiopsis]KAH7040799.1 hypothetical protein B0I36DRAFT_311512 [Microdochium trichocladiopsis]